MRGIILSAGQGTRLLPWTASTPKCLLPVRGRETVLECQLRTLAACGVSEALVVVGFGAEDVEAFLRRRPVLAVRTQTLRNPLYRVADNLVSAWLGAREVRGDFVLLNGDTLVQREALARLLSEASAPVTIAVNRKAEYDDDDMKVSLAGRRVRFVGKKLAPPVDAESIGLLLFRGDGPRRFREALEACLSRPEGLESYYLAAVNRLAREAAVEAVSLNGQWWQEIDTAHDWVAARAALEPHERRLGVIPAGRRRRASGFSRRRTSTIALLLAGLLCAAAPPGNADEPGPAPATRLEIEAASDDWLHGPAVRLAPTEGRLRPYVVAGGGVHSDVQRLGIDDPMQHFSEGPYAGRLGGGIGLELDERSSVALEGSAIVREGPTATRTHGTLGVKLRLRF